MGNWQKQLAAEIRDRLFRTEFRDAPVFIPASKDIHDYLRFAQSLLEKFADALLAVPKMQTRLRAELRNWRFKRVNLSGFGLERESPRLFLSSGSSLLRHTLRRHAIISCGRRDLTVQSSFCF